jgi:hypothetical protein
MFYSKTGNNEEFSIVNIINDGSIVKQDGLGSLLY